MTFSKVSLRVMAKNRAMIRTGARNEIRAMGEPAGVKARESGKLVLRILLKREETPKPRLWKMLTKLRMVALMTKANTA